MDDMDSDGLLPKFEACSETPSSDDSNGGLSPRQKSLVYSCLNLKYKEAWPSSVEYFGVAFAFAALEALLNNTGRKKNEMIISRSHVQKMALPSTLARAMGWLHILALDAQLLRKMLSESEEARLRDGLSWKEEKAVLLNRNESSELEIFELKKRREEDSKANEKVARIYAGQEQSWKSERKKLHHEINLLRKDLFKAEVGEICGFKSNSKGISCEMCEQKDKLAKKHELALIEKEFHLMTAMEEAYLADREHKHINERLAEAKLVEVQLREKLDKEVAACVERDLLLSEMTENMKEFEVRFSNLIEELSTTRINLSTSNFEIERLVSETEYLKKQLRYKDAAIRSLMEQTRAESEETEELVRKHAQLHEEKKYSELGENWRRFPEETVCSRATGVKVRSITQLEEIHWHEVESYERQLRAKDERISALRSKLLAMESGLIYPMSQSHEAKLETSERNLNCTTLALYDGVKTAHDPTMEWANFNSPVNKELFTKLYLEFDEVTEKLRDQVLNYKNELSKLAEKTEAELQQKDLQLASTETKLCQVLLQLAKSKRNGELITFDHGEEKIFLQDVGEDDEELLRTESEGLDKSKIASHTPANLIPTDQKDEGEISFEGKFHQEIFCLDSEFLEQKIGSSIEENNNPVSVRPRNASRLRRYVSFPMALDPRSTKEFPFVTTFHVLKQENDSEFSRNLGRFRSSVKRKRETNNKIHDEFEADPICIGRTGAIDDFLPPIPVNRAHFSDADPPCSSEHLCRSSLSTLKPGSQDPTSPVFSGMVTKRTDVRTREDIEILGLALEVKRIEQQLAEMAKSSSVEHSERVRFVVPTTEVVSSTSHRTKRSQGLAGRVGRLAKHMGFTGPLPAGVINSCNDVNKICAEDPIHFKQNPHMISQSSELLSTNDLAFLQWKAKVVSEKLMAIQTKLVKNNSSDSSLFPTQQLLDAVQAHMSQVKISLRARLRAIDSEPASSIAQKFEQVHPVTISVEKHKSRGPFGRGLEYRCRLDAEAHLLTRKAKTQTFLQKLVMQLH